MHIHRDAGLASHVAMLQGGAGCRDDNKLATHVRAANMCCCSYARLSAGTLSAQYFHAEALSYDGIHICTDADPAMLTSVRVNTSRSITCSAVDIGDETRSCTAAACTFHTGVTYISAILRRWDRSCRHACHSQWILPLMSYCRVTVKRKCHISCRPMVHKHAIAPCVCELDVDISALTRWRLWGRVLVRHYYMALVGLLDRCPVFRPHLPWNILLAGHAHIGSRGAGDVRRCHRWRLGIAHWHTRGRHRGHLCRPATWQMPDLTTVMRKRQQGLVVLGMLPCHAHVLLAQNQLSH